MLGYVPSPLSYGILTRIVSKRQTSNSGLILLMTVGLSSLIFIAIAIYFHRHEVLKDLE